MKIVFMNCRKRMDLSFFDQVMEEFNKKKIEMNILVYADAEVLPIAHSLIFLIKKTGNELP